MTSYCEELIFAFLLVMLNSARHCILSQNFTDTLEENIQNIRKLAYQAHWSVIVLNSSCVILLKDNLSKDENFA